MQKLFLGTNILFTAALSPNGRSSLLVELAKIGRCELTTSPHALTEARRNIRLKRPDALGRLEGEVLEYVSTTAEAKPELVEVGIEFGLPFKDAPILGAALRSGAEMLVTGDGKHFGHLYGEKVRDVEVVTPAVALDRVSNVSPPG